MKGSISIFEAQQLDDKALIQGIHANVNSRTLWNEVYRRADTRLSSLARRVQDVGYSYHEAMADAMESLHQRVLGADKLTRPSLGRSKGKGTGILRMVRLDVLDARAKVLYSNAETLPRAMVRNAGFISGLRSTGMTYAKIAETCGLSEEAIRAFFRMHRVVSGEDAEAAMEKIEATERADFYEDFDPSVILNRFLDPRSVSVLVARFENDDASDADVAAKLGIPRRTVARVRAQATEALSKVRADLEADLFGWEDAA